MRKKSGKRVWLALLAVVMLSVVLGWWYWNDLNSPVGGDVTLRAFVVQEGESIDSVSSRLEKEGYIKSSWVFKRQISGSGKSDKVQAGTFKISPAMGVAEIIDVLTKPPADGWVTLLEGWRVEQMAKKISDELGVSSDEFIVVAREGYMFPDTYLFNKESTALDITSVMEANFEKKYTSELQSKIRALGLTPEQGVVLASIVEREGRSDKVRMEVASVLLKRLRMGMKLDVDATVQYAKDSQGYKNGTLTKFWQPIARSDYQDVKSAYNTYLVNGLPPAPISNPSLASLEAVAAADLNFPYLYYYHDSKGNSHYAATLEEHSQNVVNYP